MTANSSPNDNPTTPKVVKDKDIVEPSQQPLLKQATHYLELDHLLLIYNMRSLLLC
ncbi:BnaCnng21030D [Brassica napus]|nr:unnamed protein product [Brassica napus]CDY51600.1 BnaCnng21030D [Brassica napus]VDD38418.1 unnamed protein product [Brassica oleracea]